MRIGLLGSVADHSNQLEAIARFLLQIVRAERVIYLGGDAALADFVCRAKEQLLGAGESTLWQRSLRCLRASPEELDEFLELEDQLSRLDLLESLSPGTSRSLQLGAGIEITACVDRGDISAEVASRSRVIAFGHDTLPLVKQVGSQFILCPGSMARAGVMVIDDDHNGLRVSLFDRYGKQIAQHPLAGTPQT